MPSTFSIHRVDTDRIRKFVPLIKDVHNLGGFIAGGFARWATGLRGENDTKPYSDIDIYSFSEENFNQLLTAIKNKYDLYCVTVTSRSFTYKVPKDLVNNLLVDETIQFIRPTQERLSIQDAFNSFDIDVCKFALSTSTAGDGSTSIISYFPLAAKMSEMTNRFNCKLNVNDVNSMIQSFKRYIKYTQKGYIPRGDFMYQFMSHFQGLDQRNRNDVLNIFRYMGDMHTNAMAYDHRPPRYMDEESSPLVVPDTILNDAPRRCREERVERVTNLVAEELRRAYRGDII